MVGGAAGCSGGVSTGGSVDVSALGSVGSTGGWLIGSPFGIGFVWEIASPGWAAPTPAPTAAPAAGTAVVAWAPGCDSPLFGASFFFRLKILKSLRNIDTFSFTVICSL